MKAWSGVNEKGEVFACNRMARDITGQNPRMWGTNAKEEFPYIPFEKAIREVTPCAPRLIRIGCEH